MGVLIAILAVTQFEPAKSKPPTLDEFVLASMSHEEKELNRGIAELEANIKRNRGNGRLLAMLKKQLALAKQRKAKPPFPPTPLQLEFAAMKPGDIGVTTYRMVAAALNQRLCIVDQVISKDMALCRDEDDHPFVIKLADTADLVDGRQIDIGGIWMVTGTYSYQTVLGAAKKVPVLSRWEHSDAFGKLTAKDRPAAPKKEVPKKPPAKPTTE